MDKEMDLFHTLAHILKTSHEDAEKLNKELEAEYEQYVRNGRRFIAEEKESV